MRFEGNVSVKAAILAGKRKISKVIVDKDSVNKDTAWILHRAKERNIPIEKKTRNEIDALASGRTHGGLLCECEERTFEKEEDCILEKGTFIAVIEGVEDPFNLGYIARTLYSAGCTGLYLRKRNWENVESTILKSSAGAFEYMNVVMCEDLAEAVRNAKKAGVTAYAAMRKDAIAYTEADYTGNVLIAIGGEMRGLSSSVRKEIEHNIYIPYANDFKMALNAAGASAVLGFEVFRQRNNCL